MAVTATQGGDFSVVASVTTDPGRIGYDAIGVANDKTLTFTAKFMKTVSQADSSLRIVDYSPGRYSRLADGEDVFVIRINALDTNKKAVANALVTMDLKLQDNAPKPTIKHSVPAAVDGVYRTDEKGILELHYASTVASRFKIKANIQHVAKAESGLVEIPGPESWGEFQAYKIADVTASPDGRSVSGTNANDGFVATIRFAGVLNAEGDNPEWVSLSKVPGKEVAYELSGEHESTLLFSDLKIDPVGTGLTNDKGEVQFTVKTEKGGTAWVSFKPKYHARIPGELAECAGL